MDARQLVGADLSCRRQSKLEYTSKTGLMHQSGKALSDPAIVYFTIVNRPDWWGRPVLLV